MFMKKKVLHILQSNRFSGAENVVCQIIDLFRQDYEMVYCSRDGQIRSSLFERNILFKPIEDLSVKEIQRVINDVKPDIIHAHDRTASFLAAKAGKTIPVVVHMHVNNNKGVKAYLKNLIWLIASVRFKHIFWVSNSSFQGYQFHNFLKKKSTILYNVLDAKCIINRMNDDSEKYDYDLVFCGRLTDQKNPQKLMSVCLKLCKEKQGIKIVICGDGDYAQYVVDFIKDKKLSMNIDYKGYVQNPLKIISSSKVMLMTSRFEGTPMVAIEAQILGTPIVSTPADGMKDIIENGVNGFLCESDEQLVQSCLKIIDDNQLRTRLSKGSQNIMAKFTNIGEYKYELNKVYKKYANQ